MMNIRSLVPLAIFICVAGCSSLDTSRDTESRVATHMRLADSLEHTTNLSGATLEYTIVGTMYSSSSAYPTAIRRAALLYLNPQNPVRNDSAALYWFRISLGLPAKPAEREATQLYVSLLEEIQALKAEIDHQSSLTDSVATVARRQSYTVTSQLRRIQELETDLRQSQDELKKLKDVDVQLSKKRVKK